MGLGVFTICLGYGVSKHFGGLWCLVMGFGRVLCLSYFWEIMVFSGGLRVRGLGVRGAPCGFGDSPAHAETHHVLDPRLT